MVKDRFVHYQEAEDAIMAAVWEWSNLGPPGRDMNDVDESKAVTFWKEADYESFKSRVTSYSRTSRQTRNYLISTGTV